MLSSRLITDDDYASARDWWSGHHHPDIPQELLPKCGVVIMKDGKPVAMGWLNLDNSTGVSMLNFIVTNPENAPTLSTVAIKLLADSASQVANELGYGIMMVTATKGISALLKRSGFAQVSDVPHYHLIIQTR